VVQVVYSSFKNPRWPFIASASEVELTGEPTGGQASAIECEHVLASAREFEIAGGRASEL